MKRKSVVTAVAVLTILGSLTFVSGSVMAQDSTGKTTMITRLAQKLGVSEDKVKLAFDELHTEHETEMKANMDQKLTELVSQGKLTEAQKSAIIAKMAELQTKHQNMKAEMKNLTPQERKAKLDAEKTELENWAKSQGIDLSLLPFGKFGGGMMKMGGHNGRGMWKAHPSVNPTTTPTAQ